MYVNKSKKEKNIAKKLISIAGTIFSFLKIYSYMYTFSKVYSSLLKSLNLKLTFVE